MRVLLVVLLLGLLGCVDLAELDGTEPSELQAGLVTEPGMDPRRPVAAPELTRQTCNDSGLADFMPEGEEVPRRQCGFVVLPENRNRPEGPIVEIAFTRLQARVTDLSIPLVVVPDGPGLAGLDELAFWITSPLGEARDIVLFDPRGTGGSFPLLDCGEARSVDGLADLDLASCRQDLVDQGIDLGSYNSRAVAQDVVSLTRALDLERVDLLGVGHGARVAQGVLALAPDRVRAVVLDSPVPDVVDLYREVGLNAQSALNRLLDVCAQDDRCAAEFGDDIDELVETLEAVDPVVGDAAEIGASGDTLALALVDALSDSRDLSVIPLAISLIDVDSSVVLELLGERQRPDMLSEGMLMSSECHDEVPFSRFDAADPPRALDFVGRAVSSRYAVIPEACSMWQAGTGPEVIGGVSDVFALVLGGEFDPLVSPAWVAEAARDIEDPVVVQIDAAGHRVFDTDACTIDLVEAFLAQPGLGAGGLADAVVADAPECDASRDVDFVLN